MHILFYGCNVIILVYFIMGLEFLLDEMISVLSKELNMLKVISKIIAT